VTWRAYVRMVSETASAPTIVITSSLSIFQPRFGGSVPELLFPLVSSSFTAGADGTSASSPVVAWICLVGLRIWVEGSDIRGLDGALLLRVGRRERRLGPWVTLRLVGTVAEGEIPQMVPVLLIAIGSRSLAGQVAI